MAQDVKDPVTLPASAPRSAFVTGLAWTTIAVSAFGVLSAVLQGLVTSLVLPTLVDELDVTSGSLLPGLSLVSLAGSLFSLWVGIDLLRRRNWARVAMLVMLLAGIAFAAIAMLTSFTGGDALLQAGLLGVPGVEPADMQRIVRAMMWVLGLGALAIVAVHLWLIARLRSAAIKAEFH